MTDGQKMFPSMSDPALAVHPSAQPFTLSPRDFLSRHFPRPGSATTRLTPFWLATGAIVFDQQWPEPLLPKDDEAAVLAPASPSNRQQPRVLLVQRAASDSMPLRWETPGGGCDVDDSSIVDSCIRELQEEAGLRANMIGPLVKCPASNASRAVHSGDGQAGPTPGEAEWGEHMGGHMFLTRRGKLVCKFYFVACVSQDQIAKVVLDPREHVRFVWATEEEVRSKKTQGENGVDLEFTTKVQWEVILEAFALWR